MRTVQSGGVRRFETNEVIQLETGLNFRDRDGRLAETRAAFELVPGAAIAWKGQHKVSVAANLNTAGAVQQRLPDDQLLVSYVYGLAYYDSSTGQAVLLAEIQDCAGYQIADNQLLFPDAFQGALADVRYTITRSGFEQDVILREQLPPPEQFQLNPRFTRLEVWTEFTGSPEPKRRLQSLTEPRTGAGQLEPAADEVLDFQSAYLGAGRTFTMSQEEPPLALVVKHWIQVDGRKFLIEAVPIDAVSGALNDLPPAAGEAQSWPVRASRQAALAALPLKPDRRDQAGAPFRRLTPGADDVALAEARRPGLVVDYLTLNTIQSNYTFASDETYFITGPVNLSGTTTFEGGAVLKFDAATTAKIEVQGPLKFEAERYRPVIFTAKDDNTVGQGIAGAAVSPNGSQYADAGLVVNNGSDSNIAYAHFRHLRRGLRFLGGSTHRVRHTQFISCQDALVPKNTLHLHNLLFHNVGKVLSGVAATVYCQHVTANGAASFNHNSAASVNLINSLLVGITTVGSRSGTPDIIPSALGVFQAAGGGYHYLPVGSPYRNSGNSAIDSVLADDLKQMTTEPPVVLAGSLAVDTALLPRVQRDRDGLDKGYHYPPLDYILKGASATASIQLTNGVAVAVAGSFGVDLQSGSSLISQGRAERLNCLTRWHCVQEQPVAEGNGGPFAKISANYGSRPLVSIRFTELTAPGRSGTALLDTSAVQPFAALSLEFCQLRNVGLPSLWPNDSRAATITLRNNLFERALLSVNKSYLSQNTPLTLLAYNNLFWRGAVSIAYDSGANNPNWAIHDNLFDGTAQTLSGNLQANVGRANNGFTLGTSSAFAGTLDRTSLNPDYQANSSWGNRYYPAHGVHPSLGSLIDGGSRTRDTAGLYYFTVRPGNDTREGKDLSPTVDIGFHYVGLDMTGKPLDSDSDGSPDYVEDSNGNAAVDAGETNPGIYNSPNNVGNGTSFLVYTLFK